MASDVIDATSVATAVAIAAAEMGLTLCVRRRSSVPTPVTI
jgi:hypothetical protein